MTPLLLPDLSSVDFVEVSDDQSKYFKAKVSMQDQRKTTSTYRGSGSIIDKNSSRVVYIQRKEDESCVLVGPESGDGGDSSRTASAPVSVLEQVRSHLSSAAGLDRRHAPLFADSSSTPSPLLRSLVCCQRRHRKE